MSEILDYEKNIYFKSRKRYIFELLTKEHTYLIWKYIYFLRKEEAAKFKVIKWYYRRRKNKLGAKLGITIWADTCGRGLRIWHYGSCVINGFAKVGENCTLHGQNCIGNDGSNLSAPVIGKNVDIGVGASIIGDVYIADDIKIGAGAVVTKSCYTKGATLVGIPANELK